MRVLASDDETTSKSTACLLLDSPVSEAEERLEMTEREMALVTHDDFGRFEQAFWWTSVHCMTV